MSDQRKTIWSWALYDAGNSAFATVVMAGFFPVFFKQYWSYGSDVTVSTAQLGAANATAGIVIALLAPFLGAVSDSGCTRKKFLALFAALGIMCCATLALVPKGNWQCAVLLYSIGVVGFAGANIFYDSLLPSITGRNNIHYSSAFGFSLGYLGGGLLFAFCVWMVLRPATFGFVQDDIQNLSFLLHEFPFESEPVQAFIAGMNEKTQRLLAEGPASVNGLSSEVRHLMEQAGNSAILRSFPLTAVWWVIFTIPLLVFVPEPVFQHAPKFTSSVSGGLKQLSLTFHEIRSMKPVWIFLLAYWCYIDGVNTIIRMAIDYGMSLGFAYTDLICALLITQFIGFPCALLFGKLGTAWGPKKALYLSIGGYLIIVLWGLLMKSKYEFYILAIMVGFFQGGIQALSRSYYSSLIPHERAGQFYGFYNLVGKFSTILGPAIMGISGYLTRSPRAGIASLAIFFVAGGALLFFVDEEKK